MKVSLLLYLPHQSSVILSTSVIQIDNLERPVMEFTSSAAVAKGYYRMFPEISSGSIAF